MSDEQQKYKTQRDTTPSRFLKWINRYRFSSEELQELVQQNDDLFYMELLDLSVAQAPSNPRVLSIPGRSIVLYGIDSSAANAYDPVANTGIDVVKSTAFIACFFNDSPVMGNRFYPIKHNRGYRGDFRKISLTWPAQANTKARLFIFKFDDVPWQCGEAAT